MRTHRRTTAKALREMIASPEFAMLTKAAQNYYKHMLEEKEKRHAERIAKRKVEKEIEKEARLEIMKNVKVGDIFSASWGYDQTNVDFFQVVELVGKQSVRVRQVIPPMIQDDPTGPMASYRTYEISNNGKMLPRAACSVFIKDNVNGDVKRICAYNKDIPSFDLTKFATAYKETPGKSRHYVSWYA